MKGLQDKIYAGVGLGGLEKIECRCLGMTWYDQMQSLQGCKHVSPDTPRLSPACWCLDLLLWGPANPETEILNPINPKAYLVSHKKHLLRKWQELAPLDLQRLLASRWAEVLLEKDMKVRKY